MDAINIIAKKHNLHVIEDSAQAVGGLNLMEFQIGNLGDIGCFSLHPLKI